MADASSTAIDIGQLDKRVLLSGAGLSRNWGGYLATEMWGAIFGDPRVQKSEKLRDLLLKQLNFESALAWVRSSDRFDESDRASMSEAVRTAFELQDANNCHALSGPLGSWWRFADAVPRKLVGEDQHRPGLSSFYFTLNQDLLFERGFRPPTASPPNLPGVPSNSAFWRMPAAGPVRMERYEDKLHGVTLPVASDSNFEVIRRFNYVKLHGSFNWRTADEALMVLGGGKEEAISKFPLLSAYFRLFRQVLMTGDVRLLVVGYGFGDDHVNRVISDAIENAGLRLVIIDPTPAVNLQRNLTSARIWQGLADLISRPLGDLFATEWGANLSGEYVRLQRAFFDADRIT